jgi:hypothetical protein
MTMQVHILYRNHSNDEDEWNSSVSTALRVYSDIEKANNDLLQIQNRHESDIEDELLNLIKNNDDDYNYALYYIQSYDVY